jgi:hypothetical protein
LGELTAHRKRIVALVVAIVVVAAGIGVWLGVKSHDDGLHEAALSSCQKSAKALKSAQTKFQTAVDDASASGEITASQVADGKTVDDLKSAVGFAVPDTLKCLDSDDTDLLNSHARTMGESARALNSAADGVVDAAQAVVDSKNVKDISDARDALDAEIVKATALLKTSAGKVRTNAEREKLTKAIQAAQRVSADGSATASELANELKDLKAAEDAVSKDVAAKTAADKAAADKAAADADKARSAGSGAAGSSGSGGSNSAGSNSGGSNGSSNSSSGRSNGGSGSGGGSSGGSSSGQSHVHGNGKTVNGGKQSDCDSQTGVCISG